MPDLQEAAQQFAKDILANNIAGLMPVFTPAGMGKAMAMQGQGGGAQGATDFDIADQGDGLIHITFKAADGEGTIFTRWVDVDGVWKVDDMGPVGADAEGDAASG